MCVRHAIAALSAYDDLENQHIHAALSWIDSGAPIFRIAKPDIPPRHLVSYFVVYDPVTKQVLLVDHKKALLWLPSGGHVDINEDPRQTVVRECREELAIEADFLYSNPVFLTITETVGLTAGHEDVSLWYVLKGRTGQDYSYDRDEFNTVRWFDLDEIPFDRADPHMRRFVGKLRTL